MGIRLRQWKDRRFVLGDGVLTVETDGVRTESHKEKWRLIRLATIPDDVQGPGTKEPANLGGA